MSDGLRPAPSMAKSGEDTAGGGAGEHAAELHGRLLNVSRMATLGEIAAGVAHELNQPLTAIANYATACERLLTRPGANLGELRGALRQIVLQTARAADILRRLRALAGGHQGPRLQANINTLIEELQYLMSADAALHSVELTLDLMPHLPEVRVDPGQIQQVVLNFVRNSLEALAMARPDGPATIVIRTSATADGGVELSVTDNGPGLASDLAGRIFDPFFSTKEKGTGLGLAISSTIARSHGGSVGYRPNQSRGASFYIELPAQPRE